MPTINSKELFKEIKREVNIINMIIENIDTDKDVIEITDIQSYFLELHSKKLGQIVGGMQ